MRGGGVSRGDCKLDIIPSSASPGELKGDFDLPASSVSWRASATVCFGSSTRLYQAVLPSETRVLIAEVSAAPNGPSWALAGKEKSLCAELISYSAASFLTVRIDNRLS